MSEPTRDSIELSVADRLHLLDLLPLEGNIVTLRVVNDLRRDLSFTQDEISGLQLRTEGRQVKWDDAVAAFKYVTIGSAAWQLIADALKTQEAGGKLTLERVPLYERFVEGK